MSDKQLSSLLTDAQRAEDRILMALCSIALRLMKVTDYSGDVRLQVDAEIRAHKSAVGAIKSRVEKNRTSYN